MWLKQKNISHCELCKTPFNLNVKQPSTFEVVKSILHMSFSSRKQTTGTLLYACYLYLLAKRYYYVIRYFQKLVFAQLIAFKNELLLLASNIGKLYVACGKLW